MRHQKTDLPLSKAKQKQNFHKSRSKSHKRYSGEHKNQRPPHKTRFDPSQAHQRRDRCSKCGVSKHVEGFKCSSKSFNARPAVNMGTLLACAIRRRHLSSQETLIHSSHKWKWYMCKKIQYVTSQMTWPPVMNHSIYKWRYSTHKLNPSFPHIISLLTLPTDWSHTSREISTWEPDWIHVLM